MSDPVGGNKISKYQPLPQTGEWARIEIDFEEEEDDRRFFVALSVGGRELGRVGVESKLVSAKSMSTCLGSQEA